MSANKGAQPRTPTGTSGPGSPTKMAQSGPPSDLEKLRELKMTILRGQHPIFRPNPSPEQLAEVFLGPHAAAAAATNKPKAVDTKPASVPTTTASAVSSPVAPAPPVRSPVTASVGASSQRPPPGLGSMTRPVIDTSLPPAGALAREQLPRVQSSQPGTNAALPVVPVVRNDADSLARPVVHAAPAPAPAPALAAPVPNNQESGKPPSVPPAPATSFTASTPVSTSAAASATASNGPDCASIHQRSPSVTSTASPQRQHAHPPGRQGPDASKQSPPLRRGNGPQGPGQTNSGPPPRRDSGNQDPHFRRENGPPSSGPGPHGSRRDSGPPSNYNSPRLRGPTTGDHTRPPPIHGQRNASVERRQSWDRSPPPPRRSSSVDRRAPPSFDSGYLPPRPYDGDRDRFEPARGRYERERERDPQSPAFRRPEALPPPPAPYAVHNYPAGRGPDNSPPRNYDRNVPPPAPSHREFARPLDPRPAPGPGPGPGAGMYDRERDMRPPPNAPPPPPSMMSANGPYGLPPREVMPPPPAPPAHREPNYPNSDSRRPVITDNRHNTGPPPPIHERGHMPPLPPRERERELISADGRRSTVHVPADGRRSAIPLDDRRPPHLPQPPAPYGEHHRYPPPQQPMHHMPPRSESRASFGGMPPPPPPGLSQQQPAHAGTYPHNDPVSVLAPVPPLPPPQDTDDGYDPRRPANGIPQPPPPPPAHVLDGQRHTDNLSRATFREPAPMTSVIRDNVPLREPQPLPRESSVLHDIHSHALPPPPPPLPPPARNDDWRRGEYPPEPPRGDYDRRPPPSDYYPPRSASAVPPSSMDVDRRDMWDDRQWDGPYGRYQDDRERAGYGAPPPPPASSMPPPPRPATSAPMHDYYYNTRPPPEPPQWAGRTRSPSPPRAEDERPYKRFRGDDRDYGYERERERGRHLDPAGDFPPVRSSYGPYVNAFEDRARRDSYPPPGY